MSPAGGASCLVINYCTDISCTFTFYLLLGSFGSFRGANMDMTFLCTFTFEGMHAKSS